jgi:hypothetical protein
VHVFQMAAVGFQRAPVVGELLHRLLVDGAHGGVRHFNVESHWQNVEHVFLLLLAESLQNVQQVILFCYQRVVLYMVDQLLLSLLEDFPLVDWVVVGSEMGLSRSLGH